MYKFDDYLELISRDFSRYKYIIFTGVSGSGKSTYIKQLIKKNKTVNKDIQVIDEITNVRDFFYCIFRLSSPGIYIIASHVHPYLFFIYRVLGRICFIQTDANLEKIERYLQSQEMSFSREIVEKYISMSGANYTDIDIILENYRGNSFDEAFEEFFAVSSIKRGRDNISY